jgi:hypothetical protein
LGGIPSIEINGRLESLQHFIGRDGAFAIEEENRIGESREESR